MTLSPCCLALWIGCGPWDIRAVGRWQTPAAKPSVLIWAAPAWVAPVLAIGFALREDQGRGLFPPDAVSMVLFLAASEHRGVEAPARLLGSADR
jgi:hypothetical protein